MIVLETRKWFQKLQLDAKCRSKVSMSLFNLKKRDFLSFQRFIHILVTSELKN